MRESISIVVVCYRSSSVLDNHLDSLENHENILDVVVVDNASPDGPPSVPRHVKLLQAESNAGYGSGCNLGASQRESEFLAFLNPDVRLDGPSLSELVDQMRVQTNVGVATCPVVDATGQRIPSAWGPPNAMRAFAYGTGLELPRLRNLATHLSRDRSGQSRLSQQVSEMDVKGHVLGGAMLVRRSCFEDLGGFDERFFMFWEDADLCVRARESGWQVKLLPATPMVHIEGTSSAGVTGSQRWSWYVAGAERFAAKHLGSWEGRRLIWALRAGRLLGTVTRKVSR